MNGNVVHKNVQDDVYTKSPASLVGRPHPNLHIIVGGAGIAGLSVAIGLAQNGHRVTVFDEKAEISAPGAGLQVASNMSRLLSDLGILTRLEGKAVMPTEFVVRKWDNGGVIGGMKTGRFLHEFGSPYLQVQRGDLHDALVSRSKELGVELRTNSKIVDYETSLPSITLDGGRMIKADVVVAADGIRSLSRKHLTGLQHSLHDKAQFVAFRTCLEVERLEEDPMLHDLVRYPHQNGWIGPDHHVQAYTMNGGRLYNLVWIAPIGQETMDGQDISRLKAHFSGWDPVLQRLLDKIQECKQWPIWLAAHLDHTVSDSGKFIAIGDAAHDMTPFLGQGAAMAVEDASLLAYLLSKIQDKAEIPDALRTHERLRVPRTTRVKQEALRNCELWHLPDGEKQRRRDAEGLRAFLDGPTSESPYIFSHKEGRKWLYQYDVEAVQQNQAHFMSTWN